MSTSFSCYLSPSSCMNKMDDESPTNKITGNKQGMLSILGSEIEPTTTKFPASLRRTLSADMSSKKWSEQQGFSISAMKKIPSLGDLFPSLSSISDSSSDEEEEKTEQKKNGDQNQCWTLILSQKSEQDSKFTKGEPYIHPLVKRSSSLSEKSLQICTESLGSETGSDGFSSDPEPPPPPPPNTPEFEKKDIQEQQEEKVEELQIPRYGKKLPTRAFPPPLPSLRNGDGPSLRMQSHRKNGRLVVEAVSVPTQNLFSAQRQDGRLLLTFLNKSNNAKEIPQTNNQEMVENDYEEDTRVCSNDEIFEDDKNEIKNEEGNENGEEKVLEAKRELINVHSSPIMMNKFIRLAKRNSTWPKRVNEVIKFQREDEEDNQAQLSKSLPVGPRIVARLVPPTLTASATFNVYENCWRNKSSTTVFRTIPLQKQPPQKDNMFIFSKTRVTTTSFKAIDDEKKQLVKGQEENLVPMAMIKGCKEEPKRSLAFWEPHYIATS